MARLPRRYLYVFIASWALFIFCCDQEHETMAISGQGHRVLLLTAHPDDECMFFAPTILSLVRSSVVLFFLCLSTGNAEGFGNTRAQELRSSLQVFGISPERSKFIDHPLLQDNFTQAWSPQVIADVIEPYIADHNITMILTFDELGISQHPNHISLPRGVSHLLGMTSAQKPQVFTLRTVPLLSKYMGAISHPLTKIGLLVPWPSRKRPTYVASFRDYKTALRAMYQHQSQLVWFRWLYVLFSRYMWVNDWIEISTA